MRHDSPILWPVWQCKGGNHLSSSRLLRLKLRQLSWLQISQQASKLSQEESDDVRSEPKKTREAEIHDDDEAEPSARCSVCISRWRIESVGSPDAHNAASQLIDADNQSAQNCLVCSCISRFDSESPLSRR